MPAKITRDKMVIDPIRDGTSIDHLARGTFFDAADYLGLRREDTRFYGGVGFDSTSRGEKDMLRLPNYAMSQDEARRFLKMFPNATVNVIRKEEVAHKYRMRDGQFIDELKK